MKRLWLLLLAGLLLLSACTATPQSEIMVQPVRFYYRTAQTDFTVEDGIFRAELRDLGSKTYTDLELFRLYFEGPRSEDLILPISPDTELDSVSRTKGGTISFRLKRSRESSAEFDEALSCACLAKTALELDGVHEVSFQITNPNGVVDELTLTQKDLAFFDTGESPEAIELTLYYSDDSGSLLLTEKQKIAPVPKNELPAKALELLLSGPKSAGMKSALPPGTAVQDASVSDGVCTVDFNGEFYNNRPKTEQAEQLAVLSVVNTLCELDGITQVQILSQGRMLERYTFLDLSQPLSLDDAVVGPVREELGEFTGVLCLPDPQEPLLHRLTVRTKARGVSKETALLMTLINRASQNGLANPLSNSLAPLSVSTDGVQCLVMLPRDLLPQDAEQRALTLRSITATLCSLPWIEEVAIWEETDLLTSRPLKPEKNWFFATFNPGQTQPGAVIS